jgi:hypothetical protein
MIAGCAPKARKAGGKMDDRQLITNRK